MLRYFVFAGLLWFALQGAEAVAGDVTVRVVHRGNGTPVEGAAVCLGSPANPRQFGTALTPGDGTVMFLDLPRTATLLTVSKQGFRGEQRRLGISSIHRLVTVPLPAGGLGPVCEPEREPVPVSRPKTTPTPGVKGFRLNEGAAVTADREVRLGFAESGEPNQYRVGQDPQLTDTQWLPLTPNPTYTLTGEPGRIVVYFQVRRYMVADGATMEVRSPMVSDAITLRPR